MNTFTVTKPNGTLTVSAEPFDSDASIPRIYMLVGGECFEWSQDCADEIGTALRDAATTARGCHLTFSFEESGIADADLKIEAQQGVVIINVGNARIDLTAAQTEAVAEAWAGLSGWAGKDNFYRTSGLTGLASGTDFADAF